MSKKLLWGIIVVLLITNIATLTFSSGGEEIIIEEQDELTNMRSSDPVATIEGEEITYGDWMNALRNNNGKNELKELVNREVVQQLAEAKGIDVDEKIIERELAYITSMQGPLTEEEYAVEAEKWREEIISRYQLKLLLTEDSSIPDDEVEQYYAEYQGQYDFSPAMQLSHILVPNMETAEKVYEELEEGASFELLAKEYSIDEETQSDGGYLGFINTSSQFFPNGYEEIASDLDEHTYSEPFVADNGIAIIYVHQKHREIEFTFDEIKDYVESELILHEEGIDTNAESLWDNLEVDWIYSE